MRGWPSGRPGGWRSGGEFVAWANGRSAGGRAPLLWNAWLTRDVGGAADDMAAERTFEQSVEQGGEEVVEEVEARADGESDSETGGPVVISAGPSDETPREGGWNATIRSPVLGLPSCGMHI